MTLDRIGGAVTAVSAVYVIAGQVIDSVNTTVEWLAVVLAAVGVLVGWLRTLRAGVRFVARANRMLTLLEGLELRLQHGDRRMSRIEAAVGLEPLPDLERDSRP